MKKIYDKGTLEYKLRAIYSVRSVKYRKKSLPVDPFDKWLAGILPRPDDTDLWTWCIKVTDEAKGLVSGNCEWVKRLKCGALDGKLEDFNGGISQSKTGKRNRLVGIAVKAAADSLDDLENNRAALARIERADIDHNAEIGKMYGDRLRVIGIEYRSYASRSSPVAIYELMCQRCGNRFMRASQRLRQTPKHKPSISCPFCQKSAVRGLASARGFTYHEFKKMLANIIIREEVIENTHSDFTLRNRDMLFCEQCIDADLLGHGDILREIYAV